LLSRHRSRLLENSAPCVSLLLTRGNRLHSTAGKGTLLQADGKRIQSTQLRRPRVHTCSGPPIPSLLAGPASPASTAGATKHLDGWAALSPHYLSIWGHIGFTLVHGGQERLGCVDFPKGPKHSKTVPQPDSAICGACMVNKRRLLCQTLVWLTPVIPATQEAEIRKIAV
jgi:hypothetical protein